MATCPRCKGHLTDAHVCPRRPVAAATEILASALAGGIIGLLLVVLLDPRGEPRNDILSVVFGALIGVGIDRVLRY
jgi:hypothetical protein